MVGPLAPAFVVDARTSVFCRPRCIFHDICVRGLVHSRPSRRNIVRNRELSATSENPREGSGDEEGGNVHFDERAKVLNVVGTLREKRMLVAD